MRGRRTEILLFDIKGEEKRDAGSRHFSPSHSEILFILTRTRESKWIWDDAITARSAGDDASFLTLSLSQLVLD